MTVMNCDEQQDVHPEICDREKNEAVPQGTFIAPEIKRNKL